VKLEIGLQPSPPISQSSIFNLEVFTNMTHTTPDRIFLKLGGSLITDKRQAETTRPAVITRLADEIAAAQRARPDMQLVIGHGSGSFGHVVGARYGTRHGVRTPEDWYGFAATADAAARLNRIVVGALLDAGLPVWGIQPGVALRCEDGVIVDGPHGAVGAALERGLVPVVFGDVALDSVRGGTIASTEEIFDWLADHLRPTHVILAGEVDGIFTGDPQLDPDARRIETITPDQFAALHAGLGASHGTDVTGGMAAKVRQALGMIERSHGELDVTVCGGLTANNLYRVLVEPGAKIGTRLYSPGSFGR